MEFYKKRVLRIYPLYWIALIVSIFCIIYLHMQLYNSVGFDAGKIIVNFFGLQSLTGMVFLTYWFIGIILIFYALYPIIIHVSKNTRHIALLSLCITAFLLCAYAVFRNIDYRLFFYFMVFASGIIARRIDVFEQGKLEKYIPLVAFFILSALVTQVLIFNRDNFTANLFIMHAIDLAYAATSNIIMISSCLLLFWIISRYGSSNWSKKLLLPQIAYGSYAAYLFDPVCFAAVYGAVQLFGVSGYLLDGTILIIGISLSLVIGYVIQKLENSIKRSFNRRILNDHRETSRV